MRWLPSKILFQLNMFVCSLLFSYLMMHSLGGRDIWGLKLSPLLASHSLACWPPTPFHPVNNNRNSPKQKPSWRMKQKSGLDNFEFWEKKTAAWKICWDTINCLVWNVVHISVTLSGCPFVTKSFSHEDTVDSREPEPSITQTSC